MMSEWVRTRLAATNASYSEISPIPFRSGSALNIQAGYLFRGNYEVAGRYTAVDPETGNTDGFTNEYTIGLSKYIINHYIKVQTDFSYRNTENAGSARIFRLQMELTL